MVVAYKFAVVNMLPETVTVILKLEVGLHWRPACRGCYGCAPIDFRLPLLFPPMHLLSSSIFQHRRSRLVVGMSCCCFNHLFINFKKSKSIIVKVYLGRLIWRWNSRMSVELMRGILSVLLKGTKGKLISWSNPIALLLSNCIYGWFNFQNFSSLSICSLNLWGFVWFFFPKICKGKRRGSSENQRSCRGRHMRGRRRQ